MTIDRPCAECRGAATPRGAPACSACRGRGVTKEDRDVEQVFTARISEFLESYHPWTTHGVMPEPGGRNVQPATWLDAARFLDGEVDRLSREEIEKERRKHGVT